MVISRPGSSCFTSPAKNGSGANQLGPNRGSCPARSEQKTNTRASQGANCRSAGSLTTNRGRGALACAVAAAIDSSAPQQAIAKGRLVMVLTPMAIDRRNQPAVIGILPAKRDPRSRRARPSHRLTRFSITLLGEPPPQSNKGLP